MIEILEWNGIYLVHAGPQMVLDDVHELLERVEARQPLGILINFKDLQAWNSSVIGLLVNLSRSVAEYETPVGLLNLADYRREVLEMCGLGDTFEFMKDEEQARAAWSR